ncbi:hypothetical protein AB0M22_11660 [Nocardia sp. NPDC051756]|uniref:hypothetical protein n=1 Tax=Nocardia sp. NPDC051756 TaxID=3154751 RepID=UPI00344ACF2C
MRARLISVRGRIRRARYGFRAANAARMRRRRMLRAPTTGRQDEQRPLDLPRAA